MDNHTRKAPSEQGTFQLRSCGVDQIGVLVGNGVTFHPVLGCVWVAHFAEGCLILQSEVVDLLCF
jgi:hypothetical protein